MSKAEKIKRYNTINISEVWEGDAWKGGRLPRLYPEKILIGTAWDMSQKPKVSIMD